MSKAGTLLFGLKASQIFLAVVTLSGVASVPLVMRSDVRPRSNAQQCASEPCPPVVTTAPLANGTLDPSVTPTPTAESLDDRPADRRARRQERRQRASAPGARADEPHTAGAGSRAEDPRGATSARGRASRGVDPGDVHDANDAPTPGDFAQGAPAATLSSRPPRRAVRPRP